MPLKTCLSGLAGLAGIIALAAPLSAKSPAVAASPAVDNGQPAAPVIVTDNHFSSGAREFLAAAWTDNVEPDRVSAHESADEFLGEVFGKPWRLYKTRICQVWQGDKDSRPYSRFVRLTGRQDQLLAVVAENQSFCNQVVVVEKIHGGVVAGRIGVDRGAGNVFDMVYASGQTNLLKLWQPWSSYEGARACQAFWPVLYSYRGGKFTDVSDSAPELYVKTLEEREHALAANAPEDIQHDCLLMETEKLRRLLHPGSRGELDLAIAWAKSGNEMRQDKAISMLVDMGGSQARALLTSLTTDPNPSVAFFAKAELAHLGP